MFNAFLCTRESYAHEKEVRLVTMTGSEGPVSDDRTGGLVPERTVVPVEVDLSEAIKEVHVSPDAPEWIHAVVQDVTSRYGFGFPVTQSDLARDPIA